MLVIINFITQHIVPLLEIQLNHWFEWDINIVENYYLLAIVTVYLCK